MRETSLEKREFERRVFARDSGCMVEVLLRDGRERDHKVERIVVSQVGKKGKRGETHNSALSESFQQSNPFSSVTRRVHPLSHSILHPSYSFVVIIW